MYRRGQRVRSLWRNHAVPGSAGRKGNVVSDYIYGVTTAGKEYTMLTCRYKGLVT